MSSEQRSGRTTPFVCLGFIWLISRILVLMVIQARISLYWEIFEVKKLLEYGFAQRAGALINVHYLPGHLSNPEMFNYVNHPYPIMWVFTLAYQLLGVIGPMVIVLGIGFAGSLMVLAVLKTSFTPRTAFVAALLYVLAPTALLFDTNTNVVALGAIVWPATALVSCRTMKRSDEGRSAWVVGVIVFACTQISWFVLSVVPALMAMTAETSVPFSQQIRTFWQNRFWRAIIIGAVAGTILFALQVWFYSRDLTASLSYAVGHAGSEGGFISSRFKMCTFIVAKGILLLGPALVAGAGFGLITVRRANLASALINGAIAALICALFAGLVLIRFYFRERTPYAYLLFPATVLTALALDQIRFRILPLLGVLAVIGVGYVCLQISSPVISNTGETLAALLRQATRPEDVVLTNLHEQQPPFPSWDTGSREMTMLAADRLLYFNVETTSQLRGRIDVFASQTRRPRFLFLRDPTQTLSPELNGAIAQNGHLLEQNALHVPIEKESLALQLRSFYWRVTGSPFAQNNRGTGGRPNINLELYEVEAR